jgi:hypothetical protein
VRLISDRSRRTEADVCPSAEEVRPGGPRPFLRPVDLHPACTRRSGLLRISRTIPCRL